MTGNNMIFEKENKIIDIDYTYYLDNWFAKDYKAYIIFDGIEYELQKDQLKLCNLIDNKILRVPYLNKRKIKQNKQK
jgi:hypothetical protein